MLKSGKVIARRSFKCDLNAIMQKAHTPMQIPTEVTKFQSSRMINWLERQPLLLFHLNDHGTITKLENGPIAEGLIASYSNETLGALVSLESHSFALSVFVTDRQKFYFAGMG
jgi:hypothetical protein